MIVNNTLDAESERIYDLTKITESDPDGKWIVRSIKLSDMISEICYERIYHKEITSLEFIGILHCIRDYVVFRPLPGFRFHKEELGVIAVVSDILSIIVMYYIFNKLKYINEEYLTILDNNVIKMKDFTVQVRRIQVD
jgi:hypothetical protein